MTTRHTIETLKRLAGVSVLHVRKGAAVGASDSLLPTFEFCWLIEVVGMDNRSPRYFDGNAIPGWIGVTTMESGKAQCYETREAALADIAKLAPRPEGFGRWEAVEHGFD